LGRHPINQIIIAQVRLKKLKSFFNPSPRQYQTVFTKPDNPYQQKTGFGFGKGWQKKF
jgi:hypothetical protein